VLLARNEARAEAEAAAEQRLAAALAHERTELGNQVHVMLYGNAALLWLGSAECGYVRQWRRLHTPCGCDSMRHKGTEFSRSEGKLVIVIRVLMPCWIEQYCLGGPSACRGARGGKSSRGGNCCSADVRARGASQAGAQLAVHVRHLAGHSLSLLPGRDEYGGLRNTRLHM